MASRPAVCQLPTVIKADGRVGYFAPRSKLIARLQATKCGLLDSKPQVAAVVYLKLYHKYTPGSDRRCPCLTKQNKYMLSVVFPHKSNIPSEPYVLLQEESPTAVLWENWNSWSESRKVRKKRPCCVRWAAGAHRENTASLRGGAAVVHPDSHGWLVTEPTKLGSLLWSGSSYNRPRLFTVLSLNQTGVAV